MTRIIRLYTMAFLLCIAGFAVTSCNSTDNDDDSTLVEYSGDFIESNNDVTTSATGSTTVTFNTETREVTFTVEWEGLTSPVVGMHFHDAGPVIHGIDGWQAATSGSVSGTVTFSAEEAADLAAGEVYTQIHTETYPGGEVVAPLARKGTDGNTNEGDLGY